jgi:hypothetical protein
MEKCSVFVFVSLGVDGVVTNFTGLDPLSSQGDTKKDEPQKVKEQDKLRVSLSLNNS